MRTTSKCVLAMVLMSSVSVAGMQSAWADLSDGLIAHWTFDDGLDPTSDVVNGNDGTLLDDAAFARQELIGRVEDTAPVPGNLDAVILDGDGDFIQVDDDITLDLSGSFSISAWVRLATDTTSPDNDIVVAKDNPIPSDTNFNFGVLRRSTGGPRAVFVSLTFDEFISSGVLVQGTEVVCNAPPSCALRGSTEFVDAKHPAGTWRHVAASFDQPTQTLRVYLDGIKDGEAFFSGITGAVKTNPFPLVIGRRNDNTFGPNFLEGAIDEVRIYDRVLMDQEIDELANDDGLIAHWPFDEGVNPTLDVANGNDGQLVNGAQFVFQKFELDAVDRGRYNESGAHDPSLLNFQTGDPINPSESEARSFLVYDLSDVHDPIIAAELRLTNPVGGYNNTTGDDTEILGFFAVSTDVSTLRSGGGASAFNDLGDGNSYGSLEVTSADDGAVVTIPLNDDALEALNTSSGLFAIGGAMTTLNVTASDIEYIFGNSGSVPLVNTQLVITVRTATSDVSLTPTDRGRYNENGSHTPSSLNFQTGDPINPAEMEARSFLVYDLSGISNPIVAAELRLSNPIGGYNNTTGTTSETLAIFDVSTDIATLTSGGGAAAFNDLGAGITYGSTEVSSADDGAVVSISLNGDALNTLNAATGLFAMGGAVTTLNAMSSDIEYVFGGSGSVPLADTQLILKLSTGTSDIPPIFENKNAIRFDGIDDVVEVPDDDSLTPNADAVTISAWINPNSFAAFNLACGKWNDSQREYQLQLRNGLVYFFVITPIGPAVSSTSVPLNTWTHIAGRYDGETMQVFIDGQMSGSPSSRSGPFIDTNSRFTIGNQDFDGVGFNHPFDGEIDDCRVYDRPLHESEIAVLATDPDGDEIAAANDNCPDVFNPNQTDLDENGFGDICVPIGTVIGDGVTFGSNFIVGDDTLVLDGVTIGDNATVGSNVVLGKNSSYGDNLVVGDGTSIEHGTSVGSDVIFGSEVKVQKSANIGDEATIGDAAEIKHGTTLETGVELGDNSSIGKNGFIGSGTSIGSDTTILNNVSIGENVAIGSDIFIGKDVVIGSDTSIGNGTTIQLGVTIGVGAVIGNGVTIGKDATIGDGVVVTDGEEVKKGANII